MTLQTEDPRTLIRLSLSPRGTLGRYQYLTAGFLLLATKVAIDNAVASLLFQRPWSFYNYLSQQQILNAMLAGPQDFPFHAVMLTLAFPFIWIGICLTVKRLRNAGLPLGLALLFFLPTINLIFFAILCIRRSRPLEPHMVRDAQFMSSPPMISNAPVTLRQIVPRRTLPRSLLTFVLTCVLGFLLAGFNVYGLRVYGMGLFVGLPFALGLMGAVIYGYYQDRTPGACIFVGVANVMLLALAMIAFSMEGVVCIVMAAPLWLGCASLGGVVGVNLLHSASDDRDLAIIVVGLVLGIPALMGAEFAMLPAAPVYCVTTSLEIPAAREQVWNRVISFPPLHPPTEWIFRMGVAYPVGAEISNEGEGAIRRCNFSTGTFVEPICVWNPPELLKFSVTQNPAPMREWTFSGPAHPPHLDGYFVSQAGQFQLKSSANRTTLLEGTTWYQHHMWPAEYWRIPSDYIVHVIHRRVLNHIHQVCLTDSAKESHEYSR